MASLRELQREFGAALRDPTVACAVLPAGNISIYRNNSAFAFRSALESGFPVLRKRVGEDYFRQLCAQYRVRFPSRSGDLHWIGRDFPAFLLEHLYGTEYAWLADLARLEWARERASITRVEAPAAAEVLANFAPTQLEHLAFALQPSLSLLASDFPVFTIWAANQIENAPPVDQLSTSECGLVRSRVNTVEVRTLSPRLFTYISALASGAPLGEAVTVAGFDQAALVEALGFVFTEELVCTVSMK
ncbi:MAG TPA: DNA-binding domain-containing protein [Steroidobacteraceae bacterium]|nr:DNA-binding domain-containing protein [Steroidobacteraceae bacterium]